MNLPLWTSLNVQAILDPSNKQELEDLGLTRALGFGYGTEERNIRLLQKEKKLTVKEETKIASLIRRLTAIWAGMTPNEKKKLNKYLVDQPVFKKREIVKTKPFETPPNMHGFTLHPYQNRALKFALERERAVLALEMGLGKTLIALTLAHYVNIHEEIDRVLVVAPRSTFSSWKEHLNTFTKTPYDIVGGEGIEKRNQVYKEFYRGALPVLIATPQTLVNDCHIFRMMATHNGKKTLLVLDEAHKAKTEASLIGRTVQNLSPFFKRVVALTGTPQPNTIADLYFLIDRVKPNALGSKSEFATRYTYREIDEWDSIKGTSYKAGPLRADRLNELHDRLKDIFLAISATDEDVDLKLPPRTDIAPYLPLDDLQKQILKALYVTTEERNINNAIYEANLRGENGFIAQVASEGATANIQALGVRIEQLAISPSVFSPSFAEKYPLYESPKVKFIANHVIDYLEEGEAVVIFCEHLNGLNVIENALIKRRIDPSRIRQYTGATSAKERAQIIKELNTGGCDILLGQSRSLETGANLQKRAGMVCHLSTSWSPDTLAQTTARVYRQGQKKHVYVLRPSGSRIEEAKNKALARKLIQSGASTGLNSTADIAIIETTADSRIRQTHKKIFNKMGYSMSTIKQLAKYEGVM